MTADNKKRFDYRVGDEISYAMHNGVMYGEVVAVVTPGENGAVEIEWEDGRKEVKKVRDQAIRLLRRRGGLSEADEQRGPRARSSDNEIAEVRRSDVRRKW